MASPTTVSAKEFSRAPARAKKLACDAPVFITHRGRTSHVLLSMAQYRALVGRGHSIVDMLAMPEVADIVYDPPREGRLFGPADP